MKIIATVSAVFCFTAAGLPVCGELILNGDFQGGLSGWSVHTTAGSSVSSIDGSASFDDSGDAAVTPHKQALYQEFESVFCRKVDFSFDFRLDGALENTWRMSLFKGAKNYDSGDVFRSFIGKHSATGEWRFNVIGADSNAVFDLTSHVATGEWVRVSGWADLVSGTSSGSVSNLTTSSAIGDWSGVALYTTNAASLNGIAFYDPNGSLVSSDISVDQVSLVPQAADHQLTVYPAPAGAVMNSTYSVEARTPGGTWQSVDVYKAWVRDSITSQVESSLAHFDMNGMVEVRITKNSGSFSSVDIRPKRHHIVPVQTPNTVHFMLDKPCKLSVEFDGDYYNNLQLIANPPETDIPALDDPDVIYYAPGYYELTNTVSLASGQTLYLAGGAYLKFKTSAPHPRIDLDSVSNVSIRGRGIVYSQGVYADDPRKGILMRNCSDVEVSGIILLKRNHGFCNDAFNCDGLVYDNVTVIGGAKNTDGFDVFSCRNVDVANSFFRSGDDGLIVKSKQGVNSSNVTYRSTVAWTDKVHRPVAFGGLSDCEIMTDVEYRDIDILHYNEDNGLHGAISVLMNDGALVTNLLFKNIHIEECAHPNAKYINILIRYSDLWGHTPDEPRYRGNLRDVRFENIYGEDGPRIIDLTGYDAEHTIDGVSFKNLFIEGRQAAEMSEANLQTNSFVHHVSFIGDEPETPEAFPEILAGWHSPEYNGDPSPDDLAPGIAASVYGVVEIPTNCNSTDETYGNLAVPHAPSNTNAVFRLRTGSEMESRLAVSIMNKNEYEILLDSLLFDFSRLYAGSPQDLEVRYLSGDLNVSGSPVVYSFKNNTAVGGRIGDYDDVAVDFSVLSDRTLGAGEYATFEFRVANADQATSALAIDNIAFVRRAGANVILSAVSDGFSFSWAGRAGEFYALQKTTNLAAGSWSTLEERMGGGNHCVTNSNLSGLQEFYRVKLSPDPATQ